MQLLSIATRFLSLTPPGLAESQLGRAERRLSDCDVLCSPLLFSDVVRWSAGGSVSRGRHRNAGGGGGGHPRHLINTDVTWHRYCLLAPPRPAPPSPAPPSPALPRPARLSLTRPRAGTPGSGVHDAAVLRDRSQRDPRTAQLRALALYWHSHGGGCSNRPVQCPATGRSAEGDSIPRPLTAQLINELDGALGQKNTIIMASDHNPVLTAGVCLAGRRPLDPVVKSAAGPDLGRPDKHPSTHLSPTAPVKASEGPCFRRPLVPGGKGRPSPLCRR